MALIFSNENRILFNRENANQLLELSYGNRVTPLKKDKVLLKFINPKKLKNYSHYKCVKLPAKSKLFYAKYSLFSGSCPYLLCPGGARRCTARVANSCMYVHGKQILDTKGGAKLRLVYFDLLTVDTKRLPVHPFALTALGASKRLVHNKIVNTSLQSEALNDRFLKRVSYINQFVKQEIGRRFLNLKSMYALLCPHTFGVKGHGTTRTCNHLSPRNTAKRSRNLCTYMEPWRLKKNKAVELLVPKIKVRDLAFGSSFLLIIMTTILQRQHQNSWCFHFLRSQTPGFYNFYGESSLQCFENITDQYLNRGKKSIKLNLNASQIKHIDFYKDQLYIDFSKPWNQQLNQDFAAVFSKDFCFSYFLKGSPKCISSSKSVAKKWMVPPLYKMHARIPNYSLIADQTKSISLNQKLLQSLVFTRTLSKRLSFAHKFNGVHTNLRFVGPHTCPSLPLHTEGVCCRAPYKSNRVRGPICEGQEGARTTIGVLPCISNVKGGTGTKAISGAKRLPNEAIKNRIFNENDTIPSKMSCSGNPVFTDNSKIRLEKQKKNFEKRKDIGTKGAQSSLHKSSICEPCRTPTCIEDARQERTSGCRASSCPSLSLQDTAQQVVAPTCIENARHARICIERENDVLKKFFYEYGLFSISTKALQLKKASSSAKDVVRSSGSDIPYKQEDRYVLNVVRSSASNILADRTKYRQDFDFALTAINFENLGCASSGVPRSCRASSCPYGTQQVVAPEGHARNYLPLRGTEQQEGAQASSACLASIKNFSGSFFRSEPLSYESDPGGFRIKSLYIKSKRLQKHIGKVSCDVLYNTGTLCNRLMSGYKMPETNLRTLHTKPWHSSNLSPLSTKYRVRSLNRAPVFLRTGGFTRARAPSCIFDARQSVCNVHKLNLQPQNKNKIYIKIPLHLRAQALPFYDRIYSVPLLAMPHTNLTAYADRFVRDKKMHSNTPIAPIAVHHRCKKGHVCGMINYSSGMIQGKNLHLSNCRFVKVALCAYPTHFQYKGRTDTQSAQGKNTNKIQALKKVPYKKLLLNEYNEVKPLFEKINQGIRMSPHQVTFKKPLFTNYNDYLSWHKDSPTAISISPSLEEDRVIDQSWNEHLERESLVNQNAENQIDKSHELPHKGTLTEKEVNQENNVLSTDLQNQALHDKSLNEEDKKREITKWEWLRNVRESEFSVEERKNLRKLAYPNKEALFAKYLKLKRGTIQNFLVSDRKSSFFGITNIFPKRLIAKDQKQINNQILQGDYDRRSVEFFESCNNFTFDPLSPFQIEQIFSCKSKIFPVKNNDVARTPSGQHTEGVFAHTNLTAYADRFVNRASSMQEGAQCTDSDKANTTYVWKQGNYVQVTKGDPLYEFRSQDIMPSKLQIVPRKRLALSARTLNVNVPNTNRKFAHNKGGSRTSSCHAVSRGDKEGQERAEQSQTEGNTNRRFVLPCVPLRGNYKARRGTCGTQQDLQKIFSNENDATVQEAVLQADVLSDLKSKSTNYRQHPVYRPSRRLRLRVTESSKGNDQSQYRVDTLNLYQSHRWWQKRRLATSLLGAPSKRYMVIPEITKEDWKKIIEWQLKTYFLEEEKRLQPLILERIGKTDFFSSVMSENLRSESDQRSQSERKNTLFASKEKKFQETLRDFKIKKIAVYLPWITLKKPLKKPFEWPLTRLTYPSPIVPVALTFDKLKRRVPHKSKICDCCVSSGQEDARHTVGDTNRRFVRQLPLHRIYVEHVPTCVNKKPDTFLVSATSPFVKPKSCEAFRSPIDHLKDDQLFECTLPEGHKVQKNDALSSCVPLLAPKGHGKCRASSMQDGAIQTEGLCGAQADNPKDDAFIYKPFLFEMVEKEWYLVIHQLLLAIAIKQIFKKIYHLFGKIISERVKNSSLEIAFLKFAPFFFNGYSRENQVSGIYKLKTRLKNLLGSEDCISSLSEIVWYLRNSCRGRTIPRGVVLLENNDSESTEVLKAIGGEAQVPVIVQSLRALPFTQNHPQRRLEKILKFAEKQAPCILFLDDLDSIGKSRTLLINQNGANGGGMPFGAAVSLRDKKMQTAHTCTCPFLLCPGGARRCTAHTEGVFGAIGVKGTGKDKTGIVNPLLNRANFSVGSEKAKWKTYKNSLFFKSNSRFQRQNLKILNPAFTNVKALRVRSQSLMVQRGCNANTLCPYGATKSKISTQRTTTLIVPETEKLIEQRRLDLMLRLLTVMDGISHLKGVLIVTTSKNPSSLDPALLRPGRFEKFINIKLPNKKRRIELLKVHTSKIGHSNPIPWENLGVETENMTGAAIADAINHSAFRAIIESTPHTLSTLEYGLSRVNSLESKGVLSVTPGNDAYVSAHVVPFGQTQVPSVCAVKNKFASSCYKRAQQGKVLLKPSKEKSSVRGLPQKLRVTPEKQSHFNFSQISFYQAGQGIIWDLFKQEKLGFQQYKNCAQDILKLYAGYAAESMYLDSICSYRETYTGYLQTMSKKRNLNKVNFAYLHIAKRYSKKVSFTQPICQCKTTFNMKPRKYFQFYQSHNFDSVLLKQKLALAQDLNRNQDFLLQAKTCETLQNLKRSTGHWYRLYLPKIERNKTNREWLIPNKFANQHISLLNLNYIKQNEKAVMCSLNFLSRKSTCRASSCPVVAPEGHAQQTHVPLLAPHKSKICVLPCIYDASRGTHGNRCEKATQLFVPIAPIAVHLLVPHKSKICVGHSEKGHVHAKQRPLALSCFYVAFQNLSEHRELLDLLADHLIRFQFLRSHEILRISLFYVYKS